MHLKPIRCCHVKVHAYLHNSVLPRVEKGLPCVIYNSLHFLTYTVYPKYTQKEDITYVFLSHIRSYSTVIPLTLDESKRALIRVVRSPRTDIKKLMCIVYAHTHDF